MVEVVVGETEEEVVVEEEGAVAVGLAMEDAELGVFVHL